MLLLLLQLLLLLSHRCFFRGGGRGAVRCVTPFRLLVVGERFVLACVAVVTVVQTTACAVPRHQPASSWRFHLLAQGRLCNGERPLQNNACAPEEEPAGAPLGVLDVPHDVQELVELDRAAVFLHHHQSMLVVSQPRQMVYGRGQ